MLQSQTGISGYGRNNNFQLTDDAPVVPNMTQDTKLRINKFEKTGLPYVEQLVRC